jgi:hypothetical protein
LANQTLKGLATKLRKNASGIELAASNLNKTVSRAIVADLTNVTPVDESTAISNWQLSIHEPVAGDRPAFVLGSGGSTKEASAAAARSMAERQLRFKRPGDVVYVSNVVDYIGFLNDGSSKQAPAGFVERSALMGRSLIKRAKLLK